MSVEAGKEFNIHAAVSDPALRERLIALAIHDNDSVTSSFVKPKSAGDGETRSQAEARHELLQFVEMTAAQQRLDARLAELDLAAERALAENAERLEQARLALDEIRQRAHQVTMPDGLTVSVYRDGDKVRAEDGTIIDPAIIAADDIPDGAPSWDDFQASTDAVTALEAEHEEIEQYRESIDETREFITTNPDDSVVADLDAALSNMPASVRAHRTPEDRAGEPVASHDQQTDIVQLPPAGTDLTR